MVKKDKKHNYTMTRCVNCNKSTRVVETFCIHCGVIILPLPNRELYCEKCKYEVKEEDDKCFVCGTELDKRKSTLYDFSKFWDKELNQFILYISNYCEINEELIFFPLIEDVLKTQIDAYPTVELLFSQKSPPLLLEWYGIIQGTEDYTEKVRMFNNKFENCMSKSFVMCYSYAYLSVAIIAYHWAVDITPFITRSLYDEFEKMFNLTISFYEQILRFMEDEESKTTIYKQLISILTICCYIDDLEREEEGEEGEEPRFQLFAQMEEEGEEGEEPRFQLFAQRQEYFEKLFSQKNFDFDRKELFLYILDDLVSLFSSLFFRGAFVEAFDTLIIISRTLSDKKKYIDSRVFEIFNDLFDDFYSTFSLHSALKSNQSLTRMYGKSDYTMFNTILALLDSINMLLSVALPEDTHSIGIFDSVCRQLLAIDLDAFIRSKDFQSVFIIIIYYRKLCGWSSDKILDEIVKISKIGEEDKPLLLKEFKCALLKVEHYFRKKDKKIKG